MKETSLWRSYFCPIRSTNYLTSASISNWHKSYISVLSFFLSLAACRLSLPPEALIAARELGLASMLAAAMGTTDDPEAFWSIAGITDPVTASSMLQACTIDGKRALFVERGAAESLARGKIRLVVEQKRRVGPLQGVLRALNPFRALRQLSDGLGTDAALRSELLQAFGPLGGSTHA